MDVLERMLSGPLVCVCVPMWMYHICAVTGKSSVGEAEW